MRILRGHGTSIYENDGEDDRKSRNKFLPKLRRFSHNRNLFRNSFQTLPANRLSLPHRASNQPGRVGLDVALFGQVHAELFASDLDRHVALNNPVHQVFGRLRKQKASV